jgi:murein DD-endopeptidase MepM/ murein hydrolase activator NlpD
VAWNNIDMANPVILPNQYVMIPGGKSEFKQWVVPIAYQPHSGATRSINNQCAIPDGYYAGTGGFIWPSANHSVSGNDFWSGHLGIDIAASLGDNVWATDSGIVVFAGGRSDGYGNTVIIEHDIGNNTYHSLYAHLSAIAVHCGQQVSQGQPIGSAGSTGNSTGPHIHFEIRENGAFINPHQVLQ